MGVNGFTQLSITQMIEFWEPQCWYLSCKLKVMMGVSCDGKRPLPLSKQHQFRSFQILSLMRYRSFNLQFVLHKNLFILQTLGELYVILLQGNKVWKFTTKCRWKTPGDFTLGYTSAWKAKSVLTVVAFSKASLFPEGDCALKETLDKIFL